DFFLIGRRQDLHNAIKSPGPPNRQIELADVVSGYDEYERCTLVNTRQFREHCSSEQARKLFGIRRPPFPHKFVELIEENYDTFRFLKHTEDRICLGLDSLHSVAEEKRRVYWQVRPANEPRNLL